MTTEPAAAPLTVEQALARMFERTELDAITSERTPERVGVEQAIGRVLAAPGRAHWPLPSAPLSIMDGYAVASRELERARRDTPGDETTTLTVELVDESAAGHPLSAQLEPGTCVRIATGAVVPAGADAVVPQEDTRRIEVDGRVRIELSATALAQTGPGRWIRPVGSDVEEGETLLAAGEWIGGGEASLLAGTGNFEVEVRRRPRVAILASGDELVAIGQTPGRGQIVATNAMLLAAQIREAGAEPWDLGIVADQPAAMRAAIERAAAAGGADLLVCTGGISVGDHDLVLPALTELGFELGFHKLALRPGRPTTFGLLPCPTRPPRGQDGAPRGQASAPRPATIPVLALPGNPAATLVTFELFARPLLRALLGLPPSRWHRPRRTVELAGPAEGDRRREHWIRARIDERGRALPLSKQLSGALRSIAGYDALVRVPAGRAAVAAGEHLDAILIRE
jgi:molybdopterin molybdotransferase